MCASRFLKSATRKDQYPKSPLPKISFAGRSNVGKSSLLNCLVGRKNLARTSSTPGRTQVINFFNIEDEFIFVDLPGYGYAKVPERIRAQWAPMIEELLAGDEQLELAVVIVDSRHQPSRLDLWMVEWLAQHQIPTQVVATKIDKVSKSKRSKALTVIKETLGVDSVLSFSAVTGEGKKQLWKVIQSVRCSKR